MSRPGEVIAGQFRLQRELGAGNMGLVYLAEQLGMDRTVVVKVMHPHLSVGVPRAADRFRGEARAAARLNHPNVVQIYVFGETDEGELYLAMEYVPGRTLARLLEEEGPLPAARALRIAIQVCAGLEEAARADLVHRDLKPENIMVTAHAGNPDHVKVVDFGIAKAVAPEGAKLTMTGVPVGTPAYMAPEQADARPVDARTDLYALGCVLHELLSGQPPFESESVTSMLVSHVSVVPAALSVRFPALGLPKRVVRLVAKCLEKKPDDRFPSAHALRQALEEALDDCVRAADVPPPRKATLVQDLAANVRRASATLVQRITAHGARRGAVLLAAAIAVVALATGLYARLDETHDADASADTKAVTTPTTEQAPSAPVPTPTLPDARADAGSFEGWKPASFGDVIEDVGNMSDEAADDADDAAHSFSAELPDAFVVRFRRGSDLKDAFARETRGLDAREVTPGQYVLVGDYGYSDKEYRPWRYQGYMQVVRARGGDGFVAYGAIILAEPHGKPPHIVDRTDRFQLDPGRRGEFFPISAAMRFWSTSASNAGIAVGRNRLVTFRGLKDFPLFSSFEVWQHMPQLQLADHSSLKQEVLAKQPKR